MHRVQAHHNRIGIRYLLVKLTCILRGKKVDFLHYVFHECSFLLFELFLIVMSTLTAYLTPNTRLSTPRLKYCLPKINTGQLSSFTELRYCHCYHIKSIAATEPGRVCWQTLTTDWLPVPLRTHNRQSLNKSASRILSPTWILLDFIIVSSFGRK